MRFDEIPFLSLLIEKGPLVLLFKEASGGFFYPKAPINF
jgi:hypothetical protein